MKRSQNLIQQQQLCLQVWSWSPKLQNESPTVLNIIDKLQTTFIMNLACVAGSIVGEQNKYLAPQSPALHSPRGCFQLHWCQNVIPHANSTTSYTGYHVPWNNNQLVSLVSILLIASHEPGLCSTPYHFLVALQFRFNGMEQIEEFLYSAITQQPDPPPPPPTNKPMLVHHWVQQNGQFFAYQHDVIPENLTQWEELHSWPAMFVLSSCFPLVSSWFCFCFSEILWVSQLKESQVTSLVWRTDLRTLQKYKKVVYTVRSRSLYNHNLEQNKVEQLSPIPPKAMMKAQRSKHAPFWHHWIGGRGGPGVPFILSKINLGQNKVEQLSPIPLKAMMKTRRSKNAPFWHHWIGGRGGPGVPFILSKIAGFGSFKCFKVFSRQHKIPPVADWSQLTILVLKQSEASYTRYSKMGTILVSLCLLAN